MEIVNKNEIMNKIKEGLFIQPKIKFKSEVQCYFVGDELLYTFEFIPSKYPDYPPPIKMDLSKENKKVVDEFIKRTNVKYGFQRLDFLRLEDDNLLLLEIEATSPFMAIEMLDENLRNKVIDKYKQNIYNFLFKE